MTISVWRYSHLALAVSSFLFIALAAITGLILAFKPVNDKLPGYRVAEFDRVTVAQAVSALKKAYPGITDIGVDANQFVTIKGTDAANKKLLAYVDPRTGKVLGTPAKESEFFQWVTSLHRSLFLHELGRFFVGLTAFLLLLIAVTGTALIVQRQRSFKRFFAKIVNENFAQYWHVVLGRLSLIPIIVITLTGTYLSLNRFKIFPEQKIKHGLDLDNMKEDPQLKLAGFPVFKNTSLANVQAIEFPFSDFPEDYFKLKLTDRELIVNQFTGEILSDVPYTKTTLLANLSLDIHTGRTNVVWASVLAIAAANILFFIWSGFAIMLKRRSGRVKNKHRIDEAEYIILVGSENGSTLRYAGAIYKQLVKKGQKVYLTELNHYTTFPAAKHLLVMTATYGTGDAPSNASKFALLLDKYPQRGVTFSVLGFGSHAYPDFCKFAFEVNQLLVDRDWATSQVDIHTVNDKSPSNLNLWAEAWSQQTGLQIAISADMISGAPRNLKRFTVSANLPGPDGRTFLLKLKPKSNQNITSGDLFAIYPANDHRERLYSIGVVNGEVQLSIRLYEGGLGSTWLHSLTAGQTIKARISANPNFYFPLSAPEVVMIANGTGIAPFLGMIAQNKQHAACHLYCGFRTQESFNAYKPFLAEQQRLLKVDQVKVALSRDGNKQYVSDLLATDNAIIAEVLEKGGVLMLCGSLSMQKDVLRLLETICTTHLRETLSYYQSRSQVLMDCY